MIDSELKKTLAPLIGGLKTATTLAYWKSEHASQMELLDLLNEIKNLNANISVLELDQYSDIPKFSVSTKDQEAKITFRGVPGGHEFTSFILSLIHIDGKGNWPDKALQERIKNIKGPVRVTTYMSLTCENCPEVVQTLNQIALIHPDFKHETVDGALVQSEIESKSIQGVPSVFIGDKIIHSGRGGLIDLLSAIEKTQGTQFKLGQSHLGDFDVLVIGGGPAGVAAAIYSSRKGLKTALLADKIGGQVEFTKGIENFISTPYTEGPQLSAQLSQHIKNYPINLFENRRVLEMKKDEKYEFLLESGETILGKNIILATGARWRELNIPGEKEYLGKGVAYCPHCDGPFYKNKHVVVIGGGNSGVEAALDLSHITKSVTLIEYNDGLKADKVLTEKLYKLPHVTVLKGTKTQKIIGNGNKVTGIEIENRKSQRQNTISTDGVFVQIGLVPNSSFLKGRIELTPFGEIKVDEKGRTSLPGVYAAGDVTTTPFKQIIIAMGEGAKAALTVFEDYLYKKAPTEV